MPREYFFFRIFGPEGWREQAAPKAVNKFSKYTEKSQFLI
jgi:hypothetical protein